jgi:putative ABC transport system substrate-binding protein
MTRVAVALLALLAVPLAAPLAVEAQQAEKVYRIGHLSGSGATASKALTDAFREGMHALGYVEGRNWILDERYAEGKVERLAPLAQELIHCHPDVLLVATPPGNVGRQGRYSTIPIVMVLVADPVGAGIVPNLARPGRRPASVLC